MRNFLKFAPTLSESWIIALFIVVPGSLLIALFNLLFNILFTSINESLEFLIYPLAFLPAFLWIKKVSSQEERANTETPLNNPYFGKMGAIKMYLLLFIFVFAFSVVVEPLTKWMGFPSFLEQFIAKIENNKISGFISIVVFAPLLEELFCRGIIMRGLLHHTAPHKAILWSATIFAVIHLNPWQAIPAFMIGIAMGWLYWKSGSLWISIFIHIINNGFSYLIVILFPNLPVDHGFSDIITGYLYYILFAVSLIYIILVYYLINKNYDQTIPVKI